MEKLVLIFQIMLVCPINYKPLGLSMVDMVVTKLKLKVCTKFTVEVEVQNYKYDVFVQQIYGPNCK